MKLSHRSWGTRVRFIEDVDRFPNGHIDKGETGTIIEPYAADWYKNGDDDPSYLFIRLDKHHDALEEWDNEAHGVPPQFVEALPLLTGMDRNAAVERIARAFSRVLGKWLNRAERFQCLRDNAQETDGRICHSHDHCDANMAMLEGFVEVMGYDMDCASEDTAGLASDAWAMAKVNRFWWGALGGLKRIAQERTGVGAPKQEVAT